MYGKMANFKMLYLLTLKFGDVTIDIYPYKYCKIPVAKVNFYYEIDTLMLYMQSVRPGKVCHQPPASTKAPSLLRSSMTYPYFARDLNTCDAPFVNNGICLSHHYRGWAAVYAV